MNETLKPNSFRAGPDEDGRFGIYGGRFVAETLMPLILDLQAETVQRVVDMVRASPTETVEVLRNWIQEN